MKIDPHCQRRNCCALRVLFNDVYITLLLLMGVPPLGSVACLPCLVFLYYNVISPQSAWHDALMSPSTRLLSVFHVTTYSLLLGSQAFLISEFPSSSRRTIIVIFNILMYHLKQSISSHPILPLPIVFSQLALILPIQTSDGAP